MLVKIFYYNFTRTQALSLSFFRPYQKIAISIINSFYFSSQSFCFELIKGTLGNKPKVYGVTFRFIPKLPDDVRQGDLKTYWILVPNLLVRGLLENCIEQATKEKNLISVNKLKIELKNLVD